MSSRSTPDVAEKHAETNTLSIDGTLTNNAFEGDAATNPGTATPVAPTSTGPYTAAEEDALAMPPRPDGQSFKAYFRGPFRRDLKSLRSVEPTRPRIFGAVFFGGQSWERAEGDLAAIEITFRPHFVLSLFMVIITEQCLHARFPAAHRVWRARTGFPLFGWSGFGVQNENPFHILHAPAVAGLLDAAAAVALVPAFSTFFRAEVADYFADNGINVHPTDFFAALRSDETYGPASEGLVRGQRGALWADRAADAAGSSAAAAPGAALVRAVALALREHSS